MAVPIAACFQESAERFSGSRVISVREKEEAEPHFQSKEPPCSTVTEMKQGPRNTLKLHKNTMKYSQ